MLRIDGKRLFDEFLRTAFKVTLLSGCHHVGPIGQHVGVIRNKAIDLFKGLRALGPILDRRARTSKHHPTVGVIGMFFQSLFEELHLFGKFSIAVLT